jgi:hypothetical protein
MIIVIALSFLVAIVGAFLYIAASNPRLSELGKIMFFCGLLAFLMRFAADLIHLG